MLRLTTMLLVTLVFTVSGRCDAQTVANDFSTNILLDYTGNNAGPGGNYTWSPSDGVAGGGVLAPANGDVMTYAPTTFDLSIVGTEVRASVDFFFDSTFASGNSNQIARGGFTPNLGDPFNAGFTFFGGVANDPDAGNEFSWSANGTFSNGSDGNTTFDATLNDFQWYRVALDGLVDDVDSLSYTISVSRLGPAGTDTPVPLDDLQVANSAGLTSDKTWHLGMKARGDKGGTVLDNHMAEVIQPATFTSASVDRDTGLVTLMNTDPAKNFSGYSIQSVSDSLDPAQWMSIADNYDADSGGSVDPNNIWTVDSGTFGLLSESTTGSATFNTNQEIDLGTAWIAGPIEDLEVTMTLEDGSPLVLPVFYTGNDGNPFEVGDLNLDDAIDADDWGIFKNGQGADLTGPTSLTYFQGDMDRDGDNDVFDFIAFQDAYDAANGTGAFQLLVPEPHSLLLLASSLVLWIGFFRHGRPA